MEEEWMSALPEQLWDVPLTHLAIPGNFYYDLLLFYSYHIIFQSWSWNYKSQKLLLVAPMNSEIIVLCKIKLFLLNAYSSHFCCLKNKTKTRDIYVMTFILFVNTINAGSHDAMSYCLDINSPLVESESDSFRLLDRICCCFTRPTIFKWATTQVFTHSFHS